MIKRFIIIIIILLFIIISIVSYYYNLYFKFYRSNYNSEYYVNENISKYIKPTNVENIIKPLIQTYHNKSKIPYDVYKNIKQYAPECTHIIMDDDDIKVFLKKYYTDIVYDTFISLKNGAHKADLARYCLLYIYGGIYMDIKTELIKPLRDVFIKGNDTFYTVKSIFSGTIYQGIIKAPKNYNLFLSLIDYIVKVKNPLTYLDFCRDVYIQLESDIKDKIVKDGLNIGTRGNKYYFFREKCSSSDSSMCYDGFDQYGKCCFVWDHNTPVIKTRRSSYPWK